MFRTDDYVDHDQLQILRVWALIDCIESKKNAMAHEIPILKEKLEDYQSGVLKRSMFILFLTRFLDELEEV